MMFEVLVMLILSILKICMCYSLLNIFFERIKNNLLIVLTIIILSLISTVTIKNTENNLNVLFITVFTSLLIAIILFKQEKFFRKLFVLIMYTLTSILLEMLITFISTLLWIPSFELHHKEEFLLYVLLFIYYSIQYLIISILGRMVNYRYSLQGNITIYLFQSIIPILSIFFVVIFVNFQIENNYLHTIIDTIILIVFSFINLISFIMSTVIENLYIKYNKAELINLKLIMKDKYYLEMEKQNTEIRKIKHDFLNNLLVVDNYLKNGLVYNANNLIQSIINDVNISEDTKFAQNTVINTMINSKYKKMKSEFITLKSNIKIPNSVGIYDKDLIRILGNILDNAIESCMKCPINSRYIDLKIFYYNRILVIKIKNSINSKIENLKTSKNNKQEHGLGIKSIISSVSLYNGIFDWSSTDTEFVAEIILCSKHGGADNFLDSLSS